MPGRALVAARSAPHAHSDGNANMTSKQETANMALFCDFENVALGVREARYADFDIGKVLERLLLKGNIVVKKAYCDWEDRKSTRLNSSHSQQSRMPSSA